MLFKEVIGQSGVKARLTGMVRQNRLSHALLMLGPEGAGSLPLALALAQYLTCERVLRALQPAAPAPPSLFGDETPVEVPAAFPDDACGQCASCLKAAQLIHPDIHFSFPVIPRKPGDKPVSTDYIVEWRDFIRQLPYGNVYDWLQAIGAENKQGNITAQECGEIIHKLSLKSFESPFKILIQWMPEYLGNEGNKLLKIIEEPPANTVFILVAEQESLILPTILSRTLLVKVPPLSNREVAEGLQRAASVDPARAEMIAGISEGNFREALQQLQNADEDWQSLLREWLNAVLKGGPVAQVKWVETVSKLGRERQKQFLRYFNHLLETAIRLDCMGGQEGQVSEVERDFALRLNKIASREAQEAILQLLDDASYYIERNANAKMLFHALTLKLYHIIANKSLILNN
jgi:DNA polymerase III subunit delta'